MCAASSCERDRLVQKRRAPGKAVERTDIVVAILREAAGSLRVRHGPRPELKMISRVQITTVLPRIPDSLPLKRAYSRSGMMRFIRDLQWSGLIKTD